MFGRAAILVVASMVPRVAFGADYYVAPGGDDAAVGSAQAPWATIGYAAGRVAPGDTVHVAAGVYAEAIVSDTSGTESARIVFVSEPRWAATIDGSGQYTAWQNSGDYVDIVGFEITSSDYLGILNLGSYVRVIGNHVHDLATPSCNEPNGGAGIDHGSYDAHDDDTLGNVVHDVGASLADCNLIHGIYHSNLRGHIWNNIVYRTAAWGLHTWHAPADVVIANNLSFANSKGGLIVGAGDSPGTGLADGFLVSNNVFVDNPIGIAEYGQIGVNTFANNLLYNNATSLSLTNPDQGSIYADPALVDYRIDGSGDYHLSAASPCIDSGSSDGAPPDDLDGQLRPYGAGVDVGPYEWYPASAGAGGASAGASGTAGASGNAGAQSVGGTAGSASAGAAGRAASGARSDDVDGGCACATPPARSSRGAILILAISVFLARRAPRERRFRTRATGVFRS